MKAESRIDGQAPNFVASCQAGTSKAIRCGFPTRQEAQEWLNIMIPKVKSQAGLIRVDHMFTP